MKNFTIKGNVISIHAPVKTYHEPTVKLYSLFRLVDDKFVQVRATELPAKAAYAAWIDYTLNGNYKIREVRNYKRAQSYNYFKCGDKS